MIEEKLACLRAHRNNIHRYRRLLATRLTDIERGYILKRLQQEKAAADALMQSTFPVGLAAVVQPAGAIAEDVPHV